MTVHIFQYFLEKYFNCWPFFFQKQNFYIFVKEFIAKKKYFLLRQDVLQVPER